MWGHAPLCGCSLCSCLPRVFHLIASEIARCGYDDYVDFAARQLRQVEAKRQELRHQLLPQQGRNQGPPNPPWVGEPTPLELTTKVPPPLPPPHPAAGVQADPISTAKKEVADSKTHHVQSTFGSWDVQKVHAVVARSTCRSQNVQSTPCSEHFGSSDVEKVLAVVARSTFWSQNVQSTSFSQPFLKSGCGFVWQAQGMLHPAKSEPNLRVCGISKNDGRCGTLEGDLQRCISHGRRSTRDMFIRDVRRSGSWFHEKGCILEHRIFRFAEMILRDRCSTSYNLASFFRGKHSTLDRRSAKIAKRIGTRPSPLHSTFHFWRTSPRIALFLMLSSSKLEEVSQTCFDFDVVKFEN